MPRGRWPPPTATARAHPSRELLWAPPHYLFKHYLSKHYLSKHYLYKRIAWAILWAWPGPAHLIMKVTFIKFTVPQLPEMVQQRQLPEMVQQLLKVMFIKFTLRLSMVRPRLAQVLGTPASDPR